jgi:glycosyltransferase involved in cell wall biosynthesis
MKVHLYGNTLNNAYNLTVFLRKHGIDATLFLDNHSPAAQDYPSWEDSDLTLDKLPNWIKYYPTKPFFLLPNRITRKMIKDFGKCDVALVSCFGPIVAMKAKVPFVFYSVGSDLNSINILEELKSLFNSPATLKAKLMRVVKIITYSPLQKIAIQKRANKILVLMGYQVNTYINKFNLQHKTTKGRLAWDINKYAVEVDKNLFEKYKAFDIVFFMIARHNFASIYLDPKGNDKFLRAFSSFVKEKKNVKLILINKGTDVHLSKKIIDNLAIGHYIEWVEQMDKNGVRAFESMPNCVVVDQFWHDNLDVRYPLDKGNLKMGFGSGAIEALAASKPLITAFTDDDFYEGNRPPVLSAFTEKEIEIRLHEVYNMTNQERQSMGKLGYDFVYRWHNYTQVTEPIYINALKEVYKATQQQSRKAS